MNLYLVFLQTSEDRICFCQLGGVALLVRLLLVFTKRVVLARQLEKWVGTAPLLHLLYFVLSYPPSSLILFLSLLHTHSLRNLQGPHFSSQHSPGCMQWRRGCLHVFYPSQPVCSNCWVVGAIPNNTPSQATPICWWAFRSGTANGETVVSPS